MTPLKTMGELIRQIGRPIAHPADPAGELPPVAQVPEQSHVSVDTVR